MTQRRRVLIASAMLLALTVMLWIRLDVDVLHAKFNQEISAHTQATLESESSSLTFMHGIGLRLNQVSLKHELYQIQAGHISVTIRLLPLMLGRIEIDALNIHDGLFKIQPGNLEPNTKAMAGLPVERIQLVRCRIETFDGKKLLDNLHLELRNIGLNQNTLWELQAAQDNHSLSGHGRLSFQQGEVTAGFGKLKLKQIPASMLRPIAPELLSQWLSQENGHINGALTLDITERHMWSIFGEVTLDREGDETPIRLRGKLSQPATGKLVWHDSFIHFDDQSVAAIDGACHAENCNTTIDAENIPLEKWAPFIPEGVTFHSIITGSTNLKADIGWNENGWQGTADFKLIDSTFSYNGIKTALPALHLQTTEMVGDIKQWQTKVTLSFANTDSIISINSLKKENGAKETLIHSIDADGSQLQPLANLMLASLNIKPVLQLAGTVSGKLHLYQNNSGKKLQLNFNGSQARLSYENWIDKPENVEAHCQAQVAWSNQSLRRPVSIILQNCQVANSRLDKLSWSHRKRQEKLAISKLSINFDILKTQSIHLGQAFEHIHGQLDGDATSTWSDKESSNTRWMKNMSGDWRLQNFGASSWQTNGSIKAVKGIFNSQRLQLTGQYGQAELKGNFAVGTKRGTINIIAAKLDWSSLPTPHAIWSDIELNGYIQHGQMTLLGNDWQGINSLYRLKQGKLELNTLNASLAEGTITSPSLFLSPKADGMAIQGSGRIQDLQLKELKGLNQWLQADLNGELHANIQLQGRLPFDSMTEWKQSNGDILIYNGDWKQQSEAGSLTERLGLQSPAVQAHMFKKLEFRFRVHSNQADIPMLKLDHRDQIYSGNGTVDLNYHLTGSLQNMSDQSMYTLDSNLPALNWYPTKNAGQE